MDNFIKRVSVSSTVKTGGIQNLLFKSGASAIEWNRIEMKGAGVTFLNGITIHYTNLPNDTLEVWCGKTINVGDKKTTIKYPLLVFKAEKDNANEILGREYGDRMHFMEIPHGVDSIGIQRVGSVDGGDMFVSLIVHNKHRL